MPDFDLKHSCQNAPDKKVTSPIRRRRKRKSIRIRYDGLQPTRSGPTWTSTRSPNSHTLLQSRLEQISAIPYRNSGGTATSDCWIGIRFSFVGIALSSITTHRAFAKLMRSKFAFLRQKNGLFRGQKRDFGTFTQIQGPAPAEARNGRRRKREKRQIHEIRDRECHHRQPVQNAKRGKNASKCVKEGGPFSKAQLSYS